MGMDTNTLLYILLGLIGCGYAWFLRWAARVDKKLEQLESLRLDVVREYTTKADCESGKKHIWEKLADHDRRIAELEKGAASVRHRRPVDREVM